MASYPTLAQMQRIRNALTVQYAMPEVARQFDAMADEFYRRRKNKLIANEAWRSMATAIGYFTSRYVRTILPTTLRWDGSYWSKKPGVPPAGIPGTSSHLFGKAVDVDIYSFSSADYDTLEELAPLFGFSLKQGLADGEPWHIVYVGNPKIVAGITPAGASITPLPEEDDLMATEAQQNELINRLLNHPAYDKGPSVSTALRSAQIVYDGLYFGGENTPGGGSLVSLLAGLADNTARKVWWGTDVQRGDEKIPALQELADVKTVALRQEAIIQSLLGALGKTQVGEALNLDDIRKAAEQGAQDALKGLEATVTLAKAA